jgi:hypothetical protein
VPRIRTLAQRSRKNDAENAAKRRAITKAIADRDLAIVDVGRRGETAWLSGRRPVSEEVVTRR